MSDRVGVVHIGNVHTHTHSHTLIRIFVIPLHTLVPLIHLQLYPDELLKIILTHFPRKEHVIL